MKLLITESSTSSCHFIPFTPNLLPPPVNSSLLLPIFSLLLSLPPSYTQSSPSSCHFLPLTPSLLPPPVTSSLLHPIFSKLCSLGLSICYSLRVSNHVPCPYPLSCLVNIAQTEVVFLHEIQLLTHILQQLLALVMILKHTQKDKLLKLQPNHHLQSLQKQHGSWSCTENIHSSGTPAVTE